jgi:hypothetical protein
MPDFQIVPDPAQRLGSEGHEIFKTFMAVMEERPEAARSNRTSGMALIIMTEVLNYTYVQAYRLLRPTSRATDQSASEYVRRMKKHYREKYPLSINEALQVNGITIEGIMADLKAEMSATKFRWDNDQQKWIETPVPDYPTRRHARAQVLKIVAMEKEARNEVAIGKADMQKMQLNTGRKFDTIEEWNEWMDGQDKIVLQQRADAAREMKLIAEGRRIMEEDGKEKAEEYKQAARAAGITGDEEDDEATPAD